MEFLQFIFSCIFWRSIWKHLVSFFNWCNWGLVSSVYRLTFSCCATCSCTPTHITHHLRISFAGNKEPANLMPSNGKLAKKICFWFIFSIFFLRSNGTFVCLDFEYVSNADERKWNFLGMKGVKCDSWKDNWAWGRPENKFQKLEAHARTGLRVGRSTHTLHYFLLFFLRLLWFASCFSASSESTAWSMSQMTIDVRSIRGIFILSNIIHVTMISYEYSLACHSH